MTAEGAPTCPRCGTEHAEAERFCAACGLPLVRPGPAVEEAEDELHERLRKIKPQLTEGELIRVAGGRHQAEAEFIQGLLLEEGVPSILRRTAGFDVPDFLAAGPRDVLVPAAGVETAREVLLQADLAPTGPAPGPAPARVLAVLLVLVVLVAVVAWLGTEVLV